jgi:hypothetical protein
VQARLLQHKTTDAYRELVDSLSVASEVPIAQVVATPPKPRDRDAAREVQARLDKRRSAAPPTDQRSPPPPGWGSPFASPYLAGQDGLGPEIPLDLVDNTGLKVPLDARIFTQASLEALKAGKFDRRHARTIPGLLSGCASMLDLDCGPGFIALRARLALPDLVVSIHDERPALLQFSKRLAAANFPDTTGIHWTMLTLNPDALWSGLAKLVTIARPDALRLSDARLPAEAFPPSALGGIRRILVPFLDPSEVVTIRDRLIPAFQTAGFAEDTAGEAAGTLLFRRD